MKKITFKEFLVELVVSDDPAQAIQDVKSAAKNPEKYKREVMARTVDKQKEIQQDKEDPLKNEKMRIMKLRQQLAAMEQRLAQKEKQLSQNIGMQQ